MDLSMDKFLNTTQDLVKQIAQIEEFAKQRMEIIQHERNVLNEEFSQKFKLLEEEKRKFNSLQLKIQHQAQNGNDKVTLNIGGTIFQTSRKTLLIPNSFFYAMLGSSHWTPDDLGQYFIDRDPVYFGRILSYLRTGTFNKSGLTSEDIEGLIAEFDYYQLELPEQLSRITPTLREQGVIYTAYDISWGTLNTVSVCLIDHKQPVKGSMDHYKLLAKLLKKNVIKEGHPGDGSSYGMTNNETRKSAVQFWETCKQIVLEANYDNLLILHGSNPNGWAHNAELGSMSAFGGPIGNGYAYCRGGDDVRKRFHLYIFQNIIQ
jgi:hypothetical protein